MDCWVFARRKKRNKTCPLFTFLYLHTCVHQDKNEGTHRRGKGGAIKQYTHICLNVPDEVVSSEDEVLRRRFGHGVVAHRARLGVVVGRVGVEVVEVLGSVLSDTQVPHRGLHLGTAETTLPGYSTLFS